MKLYFPLVIGIASFAFGLVIGREFFPKPDNHQGDNHPEDRERAKRLFEDQLRASAGGGSARQPQSGAPPAGVSSVAELLALVDPLDSFATANHLRVALEKLGADELEGLMSGFEGQAQSDPGFYAARTSVFNHLALADPERALDYVIGQQPLADGREHRFGLGPAGFASRAPMGDRTRGSEGIERRRQ